MKVYEICKSNDTVWIEEKIQNFRYYLEKHALQQVMSKNHQQF
jgi:hypothetical protein